MYIVKKLRYASFDPTVDNLFAKALCRILIFNTSGSQLSHADSSYISSFYRYYTFQIAVCQYLINASEIIDLEIFIHHVVDRRTCCFEGVHIPNKNVCVYINNNKQ